MTSFPCARTEPVSGSGDEEFEPCLGWAGLSEDWSSSEGKAQPWRGEGQLPGPWKCPRAEELMGSRAWGGGAWCQPC